MTMPPTSSAAPMMERLEVLADRLGQQKGGRAVTTKATMVRLNGWVRTVRSPARLGEAGPERGEARAEIDGQAQDGAELDHDGVHLPVAVEG
jgi:hypothetical protein